MDNPPMRHSALDDALAAVKSGNLAMLSRWLHRHADEHINTPDHLGNTLLHWAATRGQGQMVALLLRHRASVEVTNGSGATPLHCAAFAGCVSAAEALLRHGADPRRPNCSGQDVVAIAAARRHAALQRLLTAHLAGQIGGGGVGTSTTSFAGSSWSGDGGGSSGAAVLCAEESGISPPRQPSRAARLAGISPSASLQNDGVTDSGASGRTELAAMEEDLAATALPALTAANHAEQPLSARTILAIQQRMLRLMAAFVPAPQVSAASQTSPMRSTSSSEAHPPPPAERGRGVAGAGYNAVAHELKRADPRSAELALRVEALEAREGLARARLELLQCELSRDTQLAFVRGAAVLATQPRSPGGGKPPAAAPALRPVAGSSSPPPSSPPPSSCPTTTDFAAMAGGAPGHARVARDAVCAVLGEKHLPEQPQMLLVQLRGSDCETWVTVNEVRHCDGVVQYLRRQERASTPPATPPASVGVSAALVADAARAGSPLGDTEREELSRQLASLQRLGTAFGSRESLSGSAAATPALHPPPPAPLPPFFEHPPAAAGGINRQRNRGASDNPDDDDDNNEGDLDEGMMLPADFEGVPESQLALIDEVLPPPPRPGCGAVDPELQLSPVMMTEEDAKGPESALARRYEARLAQLEREHAAVRHQRCEQEEHIRALRAKRQLVDTMDRRKVHSEYEERLPELAEKQPWLEHPLLQTKDRQAALLLDKLHEEIAVGERERRIFRECRAGRQAGVDGVAPRPCAIPAAPTNERRFLTLRERQQQQQQQQDMQNGNDESEAPSHEHQQCAGGERQPERPPVGVVVNAKPKMVEEEAAAAAEAVQPQYIRKNPYFQRRSSKGSSPATRSPSEPPTLVPSAPSGNSPHGVNNANRANFDAYREYTMRQLQRENATTGAAERKAEVVEEEPHIAAQAAHGDSPRWAQRHPEAMEDVPEDLELQRIESLD